MLWLSLLFGSIVGLSLGLTGGGGAIFAVPLLAYGMGVPAREAVAISLVSVGLTSFVGFLGKWRKGEAELRTGLLFAVAGMLGAPLGAWIGRQIPEAWLMLMLSVLMLTIAWKMWQKSCRTMVQTQVCIPVETSGVQPEGYANDGPSCQRDAVGQLILTSRCARLLLIVGVAAGILSGMFGVGGGFIIVPALILFSSIGTCFATLGRPVDHTQHHDSVCDGWIHRAGSGAIGGSSAFGIHAAASVLSRHSPGGCIRHRQKSFVEVGYDFSNNSSPSRHCGRWHGRNLRRSEIDERMVQQARCRGD